MQNFLPSPYKVPYNLGFSSSHYFNFDNKSSQDIFLQGLSSPFVQTTYPISFGQYPSENQFPFQPDIYLNSKEIPMWVSKRSPHNVFGKYEEVKLQYQSTSQEQFENRYSDSSNNNINIEETICFRCKWDNCEEIFTTRTGLATHTSTHLEHHLAQACAKKKQKAVRCLWRNCTESNVDFVNFKHLAKHLSYESHVGQMPFLPKIEGVTVNQDEGEFTDNKSYLKGKKVKRYPCSFPTCGKIFNDSSNRKKHEKTHDANRERFHCPESGCNKSYSTRTDLNIHLKVHRGEYPHKCTHSHCSKAFVRLSELYAHERTHDNILPHVCPECGKRFREKARLRKHQEIHPQILPPNDIDSNLIS